MGARVERSDSEEATRAIGRRFGAGLRPGDVVGLVGPLGAGKTQFVKGIAAGLGVGDERRVNSPTFVLVQEYAGAVRLYHVDAYRLSGAKELETVGFAEMCDRRGVVVVEWADRVREAMPESTIWVQIEPAGERERRITIGGQWRDRS